MKDLDKPEYPRSQCGKQGPVLISTGIGWQEFLVIVCVHLFLEKGLILFS